MELVTADEKAALQAKLELLLVNRPKITQRIAEAREMGDLKENAEYHSAREEQGLQEAQIRRLSEKLSHVQVIDDSHKSSGVIFVGATVRIQEVGSDEIETFRLVGESTGTTPADVVEATLNSPFGAALEKSRVGDVISVRGPRGVKKFEIKEIL
jgi:transcription elongation factor GreA